MHPRIQKTCLWLGNPQTSLKAHLWPGRKNKVLKTTWCLSASVDGRLQCSIKQTELETVVSPFTVFLCETVQRVKCIETSG